MPMHFLGGFWVALLSAYLFSLQNTRATNVARIIFSVLVIGILWEFFEIGVNEYVARNPFNALDTFSDIAYDLAGGIMGLLYYSKRILVRENRL